MNSRFLCIWCVLVWWIQNFPIFVNLQTVLFPLTWLICFIYHPFFLVQQYKHKLTLHIFFPRPGINHVSPKELSSFCRKWYLESITWVVGELTATELLLLLGLKVAQSKKCYSVGKELWDPTYIFISSVRLQMFYLFFNLFWYICIYIERETETETERRTEREKEGESVIYTDIIKV